MWLLTVEAPRRLFSPGPSGNRQGGVPAQWSIIPQPHHGSDRMADIPDRLALIRAFAPILRELHGTLVGDHECALHGGPSGPGGQQAPGRQPTPKPHRPDPDRRSVIRPRSPRPRTDFSTAVDMTYAALSPDVDRILTVEHGWTADQYERWLIRSLELLLCHEVHGSAPPPAEAPGHDSQPIAGITPSCWSMPRTSTTPQASTTLSPSNRLMPMTSTATFLPLAGIPM